MNWIDYKTQSQKTQSHEFFCDEKTQQLLHAVMGIITELEELIEWDSDEVGKLEEIIDIFWYLAIIGREYNIDLPNTHDNNKNDDDIILGMYKDSSLLLDMLKKKIFYNKNISESDFENKTIDIIKKSLNYLDNNNMDINVGFDTNIAKLKARYGDKFTSDRAINRDLETEREILESGNK